jgi:hypothetical protein
MARKPPMFRIGNYAQAPVDSAGMDPAMQQLGFGTPMDKTEASYVAGSKNPATAKQAVQKARKANKQPMAQTDI